MKTDRKAPMRLRFARMPEGTNTLSDGAKSVLHEILLRRKGNANEVRMSDETIADRIGWKSPDSVRRWYPELEAMGWIKRAAKMDTGERIFRIVFDLAGPGEDVAGAPGQASPPPDGARPVSETGAELCEIRSAPTSSRTAPTRSRTGCTKEERVRQTDFFRQKKTLSDLRDGSLDPSSRPESNPDPSSPVPDPNVDPIPPPRQDESIPDQVHALVGRPDPEPVRELAFRLAVAACDPQERTINFYASALEEIRIGLLSPDRFLAAWKDATGPEVPKRERARRFSKYLGETLRQLREAGKGQADRTGAGAQSNAPAGSVLATEPRPGRGKDGSRPEPSYTGHVPMSSIVLVMALAALTSVEVGPWAQTDSNSRPHPYQGYASSWVNGAEYVRRPIALRSLRNDDVRDNRNRSCLAPARSPDLDRAAPGPDSARSQASVGVERRDSEPIPENQAIHPEPGQSGRPGAVRISAVHRLDPGPDTRSDRPVRRAPGHVASERSHPARAPQGLARGLQLRRAVEVAPGVALPGLRQLARRNLDTQEPPLAARDRRRAYASRASSGELAGPPALRPDGRLRVHRAPAPRGTPAARRGSRLRPGRALRRADARSGPEDAGECGAGADAEDADEDPPGLAPAEWVRMGLSRAPGQGPLAGRCEGIQADGPGQGSGSCGRRRGLHAPELAAFARDASPELVGARRAANPARPEAHDDADAAALRASGRRGPRGVHERVPVRRQPAGPAVREAKTVGLSAETPTGEGVRDA